MSIFCVIDDKHVPMYRIMWIASTPHFCGEEGCEREGYYEVRLEQGESIWSKNTDERDQVIQEIETWHGGSSHPDNDIPY